MTLNETYEKEFVIPVQITNVPKDVMLTSDDVDTVRVTIRDKGIQLISYLYDENIRHLKVNFKNYDRGNGTGIVPASDLQKLVQQRLGQSAKITAIKTERLNIYYNTGASKRVPVRWSGRVIPEHLYFLSSVSYSPDSVTVYASEDKLDSIRMVYTEPLNHVGFRDTLSVDCQLQKIEGVKMVPDRVKTIFSTDVLTEESIDGIPVQGINMPPDKVLRTFPAKVTVKFVTGVAVYRTLTPRDFTVVADYNEIKRHPADKCNLYLRQVPQGISRAALVTKQVDYLIEEREQITMNASRTHEIGIAGGIGSGKSYVARLLKRRGIDVYDCDAAAKRLMRTRPNCAEQLHGPHWPRLLSFPASTRHPSPLNKAAVAQFLLASEENAHAIDAIVHPAVFRDFEESGLQWLESGIMFESGANHLRRPRRRRHRP